MNKNNTVHAVALKQLDEDQLLSLAQARNGASAEVFAELVDRHRPDLLRRCRARLGNLADAEDAVQETLLRAYRGLPRFRRESSFRSWLFAIADNQSNTLHVRRRRHALSEHVRALIEIHEQVQVRADHEVDDDNECLVSQVRQSMAELPDQARDVLILRFERELSLEDIATTLGIGLSAAKMRLYRAFGQFETRFLAIAQ